MIKKPNAVNYSRKFDQALKKAPIEIKIAFRKRRDIFTQNPTSPQLNNHPLTGKLKGVRSINITGDWRALYVEIENGEIVFIMIGKHSKLYG